MSYPSPPEVGGGRRSPVLLMVPNAISFLRLCSVPLIIWLIATGNMVNAFIIFAIAGASDAADGFIAKRFNLRTKIGAYLDPLADKLLISGVFIALGVFGEIPLWLVIAAVGRDILIVTGLGILAVMRRPVKINPLYVSKLNTALQILLAAVVLADAGFELSLENLRFFLVWLTAIFTFASLAAYIQAWLALLSAPKTV